MTNKTTHGLRALLSGLLSLTLLGSVAAPASAAPTREEESLVSLTLESSTAIVSESSGFSARLRVTNTSSEPLEEGVLTTMTSSRSFSSSATMQDWAEGVRQVPTPLVFDSHDVDALAPKEAVTVSVSLPKDDAGLESLWSWGAKPLLFQYRSVTESGLSAQTDLPSFLTRDHTGLSESATPALNVATVLNLSARNRGIKQKTLTNIVTKPATSTSVFSLTDKERTRLEAQMQLAARHSSLTLAADPGTVDLLGDTDVSADVLTQPYGFDIALRAALPQEMWSQAGLDDSAWSAATARARADSTAPTIAWQGSTDWTTEGLAAAREQGYETVISQTATSGEGSNVLTGKQVEHTSAGDVTVLVADTTLSHLAQGKSTSQSATAEESAAGRLQRFVAQTALVQMQRPYVDRTVLISLGSTAPASVSEAIVKALEGSDWMSLTDLNALAAADTTVSNANASFDLGSQAPSTAAVDAATTQLRTFAATRSTIERIGTSLLAESALKESSEGEESTKDPQELARQNAKDADDTTAAEWLEKLSTLNTSLGAAGFGLGTTQRAEYVAASSTLATELDGAITVIPPSHINVFSVTAQTPVTVKNALPFPVELALHAQTTTNAISITKRKTITVPATSEAQATFDIRVVGAGEADATFTPTDRDTMPFGAPATTTIYSQLTISDMSGNFFIGAALLLGVVGIYRQAKRKKDPDQ